MSSEKVKEIKKALECCVNYAKLQVKSEQFERNMKNVLEIEKKQAVKEFAEKLKANSVETKSPEWGFMNFVDVNEIDELLKEYEK
jgi:hypothetical protein